jgi:hypothetical protein
MPKKWIQDIIDKKKRGALHEELGIPIGEKIPKTLLQKIDRTKIGQRITNPTHEGKKELKVTKLLKERAEFATRLGGFHHGKKRRGE